MGLSLVYFALGEEGLRRAVVYFLLSSALMFGLGPAFIRGGGLKEGLLFTLRLPLFYALFLGLLLKALGLSLPFRLEEGAAHGPGGHPRPPPHPGDADGKDPVPPRPL